MSDLPGIPEFATLEDVRTWLQDQFAGNYATSFRSRDDEIAKMLNEKHAPILIPKVAVDAAHGKFNLVAASAGGIWTNLNWGNSTTTTAGTLQTAVNYLGRGVLTKCVIAEVTSAGTGAIVNADTGLVITIDGTKVYDNDGTGVISRQSSMRVVVGNFFFTLSTDSPCVLDEVPGLPFNASCKIEYRSNAVGTISIGWKIAKKL